ncbi:MAG: AtpZ/AtpI family protein [Oligoflexia bacterium]|nr:AtpZ/AtpI family protein [Oligoflexia bacterium]
MKLLGVVLAAVTELVVTVVVCIAIGGWLDQRFATGGIALIACGAVGASLGFWRLFLRLKPLMGE